DELPQPPQPPDGDPPGAAPTEDAPGEERAGETPVEDQAGDAPGGASVENQAEASDYETADTSPKPADTAPDTEAESPREPERSRQPAAPGGETVDRAQAAYRPRLFTVDGVGQGSPGRRSRARSE